MELKWNDNYGNNEKYVGALWILLGLLSCSCMLMMRRVKFGMKLEYSEVGLDCRI